jgi:iron complex outermembrane recepter protein
MPQPTDKHSQRLDPNSRAPAQIQSRTDAKYASVKVLAAPLLLAIAAVSGGIAVADAQVAPAAPTDVGAVSTSAQQAPPQSSPITYAPPPPGSAADVAPSRAPLEAQQPTSVVGQTFIDNSTIPSQNYDEQVKFTPSLMNIQPAGPVSQQNYGESIRGFQYTQFNTTLDGIVLPGTPSSFAPQSAAYIASHDLGSIVVDRGPGTASTIGYATFGGTLQLLTKEPSETFNVNPYSTVGSYGERLGGVEVDTGALPELDGGRGFIDLSRLDSDAALSGVTTNRTNGFVKWEQPIGDSTTVTFAGLFNSSTGDTPYGSTLQQINQYGPGYGLNSNPKSQDYAGYNTDSYTTDFEYLRIASDLGGGWNLEVTPYTASYYHHGTEGADPNGTTPNLGQPGSTKEFINGVQVNPTNDVPGIAHQNDFRDWGTTVRLTDDTAWGQLRTGVWFDYISNGASRSKIDFTDGDAVYTTSATAPELNQQYSDTLTTVMPYLEFAWKPLPQLTITPGIRFSDIQRDLDVITLSGTPSGRSSHTWTAWQASVDAHYQLTPHWSAYAQVAQGFLAPPLNTLETTSPVGVTPETTMNYQVGTAFQNNRLAVGADVYYITFQNYIASNTIDDEAVYSNDGGAVYKGIEAEGTYKLIGGLSVTANGSLNDATFTDGAPVYQAPQHTAAFGFIYDQNDALLDKDNVYGSILAKNIGKQYGANINTANGPTAAYPIGAYSNVDLALGYTLPLAEGHKVRLAVNLYNILNDRSVIGFAGNTANGVGALYWTDPGFSAFFSVSASL